MALKSGRMSYLKVPPETVRGASQFLDSVADERGAKYGYTGPEARPSTTAIGLLCRMHLGWKLDDENLAKGIRYLDELGPSPRDMYYNYYATQVMHHYGRAPWKRWNSRMRDRLVHSQAGQAHEDGSWFMPDPHCSGQGGRLYCTAMAAMILEVYYRHLPIYRQESVEDDFPLN
jgi:hypothetical protein